MNYQIKVDPKAIDRAKFKMSCVITMQEIMKDFNKNEKVRIPKPNPICKGAFKTLMQTRGI